MIVGSLLMAAASTAPLEALRLVPTPTNSVGLFAIDNPGLPPPVCETVWPKHLDVCVQYRKKGGWGWATLPDIQLWGTTSTELIQVLRERDKGVLEGEPHRMSVVDSKDTYFILLDDAGLAVIPALYPTVLARRVGGERVRVAIPRVNTLLAWRSGSSELDQIMAVAVREMYDKSTTAISPMIHVWTGEKMEAFGQAKAVRKSNE